MQRWMHREIHDGWKASRDRGPHVRHANSAAAAAGSSVAIMWQCHMHSLYTSRVIQASCSWPLDHTSWHGPKFEAARRALNEIERRDAAAEGSPRGDGDGGVGEAQRHRGAQIGTNGGAGAPHRLRRVARAERRPRTSAAAARANLQSDPPGRIEPSLKPVVLSVTKCATIYSSGSLYSSITDSKRPTTQHTTL